MQTPALFYTYLFCCGAYLLGIYTDCMIRRTSWVAVTASHLVPTAIALIMARIFLIGRAATTAQLVAGSEHGMALWSLWFNLGPFLLLASFMSALVLLICTAATLRRAGPRRYLPVTAAGVMMSGFSFFIVALNAPDA